MQLSHQSDVGLKCQLYLSDLTRDCYTTSVMQLQKYNCKYNSLKLLFIKQHLPFDPEKNSFLILAVDLTNMFHNICDHLEQKLAVVGFINMGMQKVLTKNKSHDIWTNVLAFCI